MDWVASAITLSKLSLKPNLQEALEPTPRQYHFQIELGFKKSSTSKWPTQPPPPPAHHLASSGSAFPAQKCPSEQDKERHFTSSFCLVVSLGKSPSYNGCLKSLVLDWLEKDGLGWLKVRNEFEGPVGFFLRHATLLTRLSCTIAVLPRRYLLKPQPIYDVYQVQFWSYGIWKLNNLLNQPYSFSLQWPNFNHVNSIRSGPGYVFCSLSQLEMCESRFCFIPHKLYFKADLVWIYDFHMRSSDILCMLDVGYIWAVSLYFALERGDTLLVS